MARKGLYKEWLTDDKLILLEGWAREGLRDIDLAQKIGISVKTFYEWQNRFSEFSKAIKKGKEVIDFEVENALLKRALGYTKVIKEDKITKDGDVIETEKEVHIPGDTTAQIFWLKNRKPKEWRDRVENFNTNLNTDIDFDLSDFELTDGNN